MTVEERVIAKLRKVLIADSVIDGFVKKRVYGSHVSNVNEPKYPAISLHLLPGTRAFSERGFVNVNVQIDVWLLSTENDQGDMFTVIDRVRTLLDRANLIDSSIPIKVAMCVETNSGQMMSDPDTRLTHYPLIYQVVAS